MILKTILQNRASFGRYSPDLCHRDLVYRRPLLAYEDRGQEQNYKEELRSALNRVLGDMPDFAVTAKKEWERTGKNYIETRYLLQTEEKCFCPCLLVRPNGIEKPPVVLCMQGHSQGMQLSMARPYRLKDFHKIADDRDFALQAVENGYAALVIEQRCFGERRSHSKSGCIYTAHEAILLGRTLLGERVWDIRKAIDFLRTLPEVDGTKIGAMGNSGGGTAAFYSACVDDRISIVMPGCSVCTYADSVLMRGHCACNYIPGAAKYFDMGDLSALIAPRRFVLVCGEKDPLFLYEGTKKTFSLMQKIYADCGVPDGCALVVGSGAHRFYREGWVDFNRYAAELWNYTPPKIK